MLSTIGDARDGIFGDAESSCNFIADWSHLGSIASLVILTMFLIVPRQNAVPLHVGPHTGQMVPGGPIQKLYLPDFHSFAVPHVDYIWFRRQLYKYSLVPGRWIVNQH